MESAVGTTPFLIQAAAPAQAVLLVLNVLPWYYMFMTFPRSRLTSQGQISIPAEIRRKLGLDAGAVVEWDDADDGRVSLRRAGRFTSEDVHRALFPQPPSKASTVAEMDNGIRRLVQSRRARR